MKEEGRDGGRERELEKKEENEGVAEEWRENEEDMNGCEEFVFKSL
jgi:hypothetical protein